MSGKSMAEVIEAAAEAIWNVDRTIGDAPYERCADSTKEQLRIEARAALEAAAPFIAAKALEDAATALDGKRLLTKPFHEYYPEWLRARAAAVRGEG